MRHTGPALMLLVLGLTGCTGLFFWPDRELPFTPRRFDLAYQEVRFRAPDGPLLHGWHLPAAAPRGLVLHLHGNASNIAGHLPSVAWLPAAGWSVLTFDYRGYGRSSGEPTLAGLHADARAALDYALGRWPGVPLVVFGQSLGGALGIWLVGRQAAAGEVAGLVVEGAFAGYRDIARDKLAAGWLTWPLQLPLSWTVSDAYRPLEAIPGVAPRPVLIIHAREDEVVPPSHAERLYRAARPPREIWRVPGSAHGAAMAQARWKARLRAWLDRLVPTHAPGGLGGHPCAGPGEGRRPESRREAADSGAG